LVSVDQTWYSLAEPDVVFQTWFGLLWSGLVKSVVCPDKPWCDLAEPYVCWSDISGAKRGQQHTNLTLPGLIWYILVLVWCLVIVFTVWPGVVYAQSVHNIIFSLIFISNHKTFLILRHNQRIMHNIRYDVHFVCFL
jgi:hypothetical protein